MEKSAIENSFGLKFYNQTEKYGPFFLCNNQIICDTWYYLLIVHDVFQILLEMGQKIVKYTSHHFQFWTILPNIFIQYIIIT
jgi:hypothetical protein